MFILLIGFFIKTFINNLIKGEIFMAYTHEQFLQQVYDLVGDEYTVLSKYESTNKKVEIKHNTCGLVFLMTPNHFKNGNRCPKCSKKSKRKSNIQEFKQKVYDLVRDEYTVLGTYKTNKDHILMKHNTCGHEYYVRPDMFVNTKASRCPKCASYGPSREEKDLVTFIKSFYTTICCSGLIGISSNRIH